MKYNSVIIIILFLLLLQIEHLKNNDSSDIYFEVRITVKNNSNQRNSEIKKKIWDETFKSKKQLISFIYKFIKYLSVHEFLLWCLQVPFAFFNWIFFFF